MPTPHLSIKIIQRSTGQSGVAAAAYQSGQKLYSECIVQKLCLVEYGTISIGLWNQLYEIPVKRTFQHMKIKDLESTKKIIHALDLQDPIKIVYVPSNSNSI